MNTRFKDKNFIMFFVVTVLLCAIFLRLIVLQVVKGSDYLEQSKSKLTNSMTVSAPRGVIYDRNGRPLITNRVGFSVQVVHSDSPGDKINDILLSVVDVLKKNGDEYVDSLPISADDYKYTYKDDERKTAKAKIK